MMGSMCVERILGATIMIIDNSYLWIIFERIILLFIPDQLIKVRINQKK